MTYPLFTLLTVPLAIALTIPIISPTATSPPTAETLRQELSAVSATQQTHTGPYSLTP